MRQSQYKSPKLKSKENKEWKKKRERITKDSGTTTKDVTHIMGVTEREEREKGIEETFETTMAENFPQLIKPEIQEVQRTTAYYT